MAKKKYIKVSCHKSKLAAKKVAKNLRKKGRSVKIIGYGNCVFATRKNKIKMDVPNIPLYGNIFKNDNLNDMEIPEENSHTVTEMEKFISMSATKKLTKILKADFLPQGTGCKFYYDTDLATQAGVKKEKHAFHEMYIVTSFYELKTILIPLHIKEADYAFRSTHIRIGETILKQIIGYKAYIEVELPTKLKAALACIPIEVSFDIDTQELIIKEADIKEMVALIETIAIGYVFQQQHLNKV